MTAGFETYSEQGKLQVSSEAPNIQHVKSLRLDGTLALDNVGDIYAVEPDDGLYISSPILLEGKIRITGKGVVHVFSAITKKRSNAGIEVYDEVGGVMFSSEGLPLTIIDKLKIDITKDSAGHISSVIPAQKKYSGRTAYIISSRIYFLNFVRPDMANSNYMFAVRSVSSVEKLQDGTTRLGLKAPDNAKQLRVPISLPRYRGSTCVALIVNASYLPEL